ncbi:MAG: HD domain-containing protein [Lachnospiraceae bacterium]|nr:HD domain-containing protein [Lachnospiraceae bacterium]
MNINRRGIREVFDEYVGGYNVSDPKIRLKKEHTYRVADNAERIANSLIMKDERERDCPVDVDQAWVLGMLHDIGRFEQIKRYNTFIDSKSIDHAGFGADILFKDRLIERFLPDISKAEEELFDFVIRNHSEYRLPENINDIYRTYCNILRDADKIDIFKVNCEVPLEDIYNVPIQEMRQSKVSEEVKECFREHKAVLRGVKKTPADNIVGHICLFFELVYPESYKIAKEQGFVNEMLDFETDDPETAAWFEYMKKELEDFPQTVI